MLAEPEVLKEWNQGMRCWEYIITSPSGEAAVKVQVFGDAILANFPDGRSMGVVGSVFKEKVTA